MKETEQTIVVTINIRYATIAALDPKVPSWPSYKDGTELYDMERQNVEPKRRIEIASFKIELDSK